MIKIEMQERDLQIYLQEQANLAAKQNQTIIDVNARLANANAALTAEQNRHRVTSDKVYGLQSEVESHKYTIDRHKAQEAQHKLDLEAAKKVGADPNLVAVELGELLTNLLSGKPNKIDAIKVVRSLTGWGLKEARDLYEGVEIKVAAAKIKAA